VDERAVRGAGDIPCPHKLDPESQNQASSPWTCWRTHFESQSGVRVDGSEKVDAPHPDFRLHLRGDGQVREASRGLVGLDASAHVLRLIDLGHKSSLGWEIHRPSLSMSARGFDERDLAESFFDVEVEDIGIEIQWIRGLG